MDAAEKLAIDLDDSQDELDYRSEDQERDEPGAGAPSSSSTSIDLEEGAVLGAYRVERRIAEGGMGKLYLARHVERPGSFAIKVPHAAVARTADVAAHLREEAALLASLDHPNIVKLVALEETLAGAPYVVMEFLEGCDLASVLIARRRLRPPEVASVMRQLASALSSAHAGGIVHRDLKPENVFIIPTNGRGDIIKLIDFGAAMHWRTPRQEAGGALIGTPSYMSPEQIHGGRPVDDRTDQFALAVLAYEMLTGHPPFKGDSVLSTLYRVVNASMPPLGSRGDVDVGPEVEGVLRRALEKEPLARYASVHDFAGALERALLGTGREGHSFAPLRLVAGSEPRIEHSLALAFHDDVSEAGSRREMATVKTQRLRRIGVFGDGLAPSHEAGAGAGVGGVLFSQRLKGLTTCSSC